MQLTYFYIALGVHLISLITAFGSVLVIDTFGLLWLLKNKHVNLKLVTQVAKVTQVLIWLGWSGLVLSGIVLLTTKGFVDNLTKVKLFFVLLVGLNGVYLHYIKKGLLPFIEGNIVPRKTFLRMMLATTISQVGWWAAITIGFLHRHWQSYIPWPENWVTLIVAIFLVFASALVSVEYFFKSNER